MPSDFVRGQAPIILEFFYSTPFIECHPLTRAFSTIPARSGIYAFRHQSEEILYIGKAVNIMQRLRGGHKALAWAFIDRLNPDDLRIVAMALDYQSWLQVLEIEALMIQIVKPCYNIRMRQEE